MIAATCALPKMLLLLAFLLGVMYELLFFGHTQHAPSKLWPSNNTSLSPTNNSSLPPTTTNRLVFLSPATGQPLDNPPSIGDGGLNDRGYDYIDEDEADRMETVNAEEPEPTTEATFPQHPSTSFRRQSLFFQIVGTKFIKTVVSAEDQHGEREDAGGRSNASQVAEEGDSPVSLRGSTPAAANSSETLPEAAGSGAPRRTMLQLLVESKFSWIDVITAVGCTVAALLVLVNLALCIKLARHRHRRLRHHRLHRRPGPTHCLGGAHPVTTLCRPWLHPRAASGAKTEAGGSKASRMSAHTTCSLLSIVSDASTQYERMDAMLASFVGSELIGELNDRDSTCTSVSEGFTFSRDYLEAGSKAGLTGSSGCTEF